MSLRTKGALGISIPLIALAVTVTSFGIIHREETAGEAAIARSLAVQRQIQVVLSEVLNAETAVRGYVAAGDERLLTPYEATLASFRGTLDRLEFLVRRMPTQWHDARRVEQLGNEELDTLSTLRWSASGPFRLTSGARREALLDGSATTNEIRALLDDMQSLETRRLDAQRSAQRRTESVAVALIVASLLVGVVGGLVATLLFTTSVVRRSKRVRENAARLAEGLPLIPGERSADEIGRIESGLGEAAALLQRREAELRASEERFRLLAENSQDVISRFRLVPEPALEYISPAVERLTGRSQREFYDNWTLMFEIILPEDRPAVEQILVAGAAPETLVTRMRRPDGTIGWMESRISVIRDATGSPVAVESSARDITPRVVAEEALRRSETMKSTILASIAEGTMITDCEGRIIAINPAMERLTGWSEEEVRGRVFTDAYPTFDQRGMRRSWETTLLYRAIRDGERVSTRGYNQSMATKDGRCFPYGGTASPLVDERGTVTGGVEIFRDVTYEMEVDQLKTSLISTVSHELRTPLTMIRGFSELLLDRSLGERNSEEAIRQIKVSAERLTRLIEDLLSVSRLESGRVEVRAEPVDIVEAVQDVARHFAVEREIGIDADADIEALADPDMLIQILTNLVSNAVKYSPPGSPVHVRVFEDGGAVAVEVRDEGIGMGDADRKQLFQKFFRSDSPDVRNVGGTGLGLYITKSLVELLGGDIRVESEHGLGTTVTFTLPPAPQPAELAAS